MHDSRKFTSASAKYNRSWTKSIVRKFGHNSFLSSTTRPKQGRKIITVALYFTKSRKLILTYDRFHPERFFQFFLRHFHGFPERSYDTQDGRQWLVLVMSSAACRKLGFVREHKFQFGREPDQQNTGSWRPNRKPQLPLPLSKFKRKSKPHAVFVKAAVFTKTAALFLLTLIN